mgnify:CR=1 FL=1
MEILTNYSEDTLQLISDGTSYSLPEINETHTFKLSVFNQSNSFLGNFTLEQNKDFYIKNNQLFLKPNELLDRENFSQGNYNLQFDFIIKYGLQELYVAEVSPSRKEVRLRYQNQSDTGIPQVNQGGLTNFLNESNVGNDTPDNYKFNSFLELTRGRLLPITNYAFDNVTNGVDGRSVILRFNEAVPGDLVNLSTNFDIVNKFLASQTETIFFVDKENLAVSGRGLVPDESFILNEVNESDSYKNYNEITGSVGTNVLEELKRTKKDKNLNIDFSKFSNHVFFGSAELKLKNFKDKAVKLEGLYTELSSSLSLSSSKNVVDRRKNLFSRVNEIQDGFTAYEHFLYNDNQSYSTASAPGLGTNLAGTNFKNNFVTDEFNTLTFTSNTEGFDKIYTKTSDAEKYLHLFTDVYNVEAPPFYNTNKDVYLSFLLRGGDTITGSAGFDLNLSGGDANISYGNNTYNEYNYGRTVKIPYECYSSGSSLDFSNLVNSTSTGSAFKRYVFKGKQEHWRPEQDGVVRGDIIRLDIASDTFYSASNGVHYEILSGSESVISASISGSLGDGFAYGIRDSSGLHTPFFFPNYLDENNLNNLFSFVTASVSPQGDLFPIYLDTAVSGSTVYLTDINVSYNNPTNILPFSKIHRPPSGSYAGSSEWNSWYDGFITSASQYDNDNIHSLVNNLPMTLRTDEEHNTLRNFVHMLGEQFDLLRNYIDNYHNFYKLGYKSKESIPENLLPIFGDSLGWKMMSPFSGSALNDYVSSNVTDEGGIQSAINMTWKKILNNIIYVYKTKGTTESIKSLLNFYGLDGNSFNLQEYGGSNEEHNPTIIENNSKGLLQGLKKKTGNVSFVEEVKPFPMMNVDKVDSYLGIDWWSNDAKPNGVEFIFNANKSTSEQKLLRMSGSAHDLWDVAIVPSASSNTTGQLRFRLNYTYTGSSDITGSAISMSTDYIDNLMGDNLFNMVLQKQFVTASYFNLTQSYHLSVGRKDNDKIRDVQIISMSSHDVLPLAAVSSSNINQNFMDTGSNITTTTNNLLVGETLSGSIAEIRAWDAYLSASKFKQHILNYQSTVGSSIKSSKDDVIYRFPLNEGIVDWSIQPNSASLKINDANPKKVKDYSISIKSQPKLNPKTVTTEQKFFKFGVRGSDSKPNNNVSNLAPKLKTAAPLNPNLDSLTQPEDNGTPSRDFPRKFGKSLSYVNSIDSVLMNMIPDFQLDDYIGQPDDELADIYTDLITLRKDLITDMDIKVDVVTNLKATENIMSNAVITNLKTMVPAKTKFEFAYDVKNDSLFRSRRKKAKLQTKLNPNKAIGVIDADQWDEPSISVFNQTIYSDSIDSGQLVITGSRLNIYSDTIDTGQLTVTASQNENFFINDSNRIQYLAITGSFQPIHYAQLTGSAFTDLFLGSKNEFYTNWGTASDNTFFYSKNPGNDGKYNTYKYESRFTFKTIGDTEVFGGSASIHTNYREFENRYFVDQNHVAGYSYDSHFGDSDTEKGSRTGRMVGRTRFFKVDSDGNITYPSNHFITARTSKDVLDNLIYKGTQHTGKPVTIDPLGLDVFPSSSAYVIKVGGSDTLKKLKVIRDT